VIRVENGWGYELYNQERIVIIRNHTGDRGNNLSYPAKMREDSKLALQKLYKGRIPRNYQQDLDSLKILYPETDIMID